MQKFWQSYGTILLSSLLACSPAVFGYSPQQMIGAEVQSVHSTGYGLYVVQMKPSDVPGVISSFFLFSTAKLWPKSWAEIDLEFTPGYETGGEQSNRFVLNGDQGHCFDSSGHYQEQFFQKNCPVISVEQDEIVIKDSRNRFNQKINRALAFNTFGNTPLVMDQRRTGKPDPIVQEPSDYQVFYLPPQGIDPFKNFYNYYIWYTPRGIFWSGPVDPNKFAFPKPQENLPLENLPKPIFAKLWNSNQGGENGQPKPAPEFQSPADKTFQSTAQKHSMAYASDQFTPLDHSTGGVLNFGRSLKIMMNIWDGSYTALHSGKQPWGGWDKPSRETAAIYKKVAFFPIKVPVKMQDDFPEPNSYQYGSAKLYSDFTSVQGTFFLDGQKASFSQLWRIEDGADAPLGIRSGYHVLCYPHYFNRDFPLAENGLYLHLRPAGDYALPADGAMEGMNNSQTNCRWADQRGIQ
ncbi:MAG: family 16 glycosylhydrolase [Oligoflexus sp.]